MSPPDQLSHWHAGSDAPCHASRLATLRSYRILDTPSERCFDDIVEIAAALCETPVSLVSLVAEDRQWFKARVGFDPTETPLEQSVCAHALGQSETLVIPDLASDVRTDTNALVRGAPFMRFYAGAPLRTPGGTPIGTLCVIDTEPRAAGLTTRQRSGLEALARQVMSHLDMRSADIRRAALLKLGDALRALASNPDRPDTGDMAFAAAEIMGRAIGCDRVGYGTMDVAGEILLVERDWMEGGVANIAGSHRMTDYGAYIDDLRRGEAVVIDDVRLDPRCAEKAAALEAVSARAILNVPVMEQGRLVALFYLNCRHPRAWLPDEVAFVHEVAVRIRDAVERRRAESEVRDLADALARRVEERTLERDRVWNATTDLMGTVGLDGYLRAVNPAWSRRLGWSEAELLGTPFARLIAPADLDASRDALARLTAGESVSGKVDRVLCRNGQRRVVMWDAVPDGPAFHIVGRDITELRRVEDLLRQSQKMDAVGQLTGGIAHDFNNLLTGMVGSLELLRVRIGQRRLTEIDRYVTAAQGAAARATSLTHRLLAFARQQMLDPRPTDVASLVSGMADRLAADAGPTVALRISIADGSWDAMVDGDQLEQALLGLCANALEAMPNGGTLSIEAANRTVYPASAESDLPPGDYMVVSVVDDGVGMAPETAACAFDPFFTTKPLGRSAGLGLSMVYGFVRQSGGHARIVSAIGAGTTVSLHLPRHAGPGERQPIT